MDIRLISISEAARLLGIGRSTAYQLAKDGRLPCVRGFGPVRVNYHKLVEMIEAGTTATLAPASGAPEEALCRTKEAIRGGLATPHQMARTLDDLLAPRITLQQRL
jgi:excisionase family DNA binding protein